MTNNIQYNWPEDFGDEVPPEDSVPATGVAFRFVKQMPPTEDDFLSTREEKPERPIAEHDRIKSFGVSLFRKLDKAIKKRTLYKNAMGNRKIAKGELVNNLGKISRKPSRDSHITLWKQVGAEPHLCVCHPAEDES